MEELPSPCEITAQRKASLRRLKEGTARRGGDITKAETSPSKLTEGNSHNAAFTRGTIRPVYSVDGFGYEQGQDENEMPLSESVPYNTRIVKVETGLSLLPSMVPASPTTPRLKRMNHFSPDELYATPRGSVQSSQWNHSKRRKSGIPIPKRITAQYAPMNLDQTLARGSSGSTFVTAPSEQEDPETDIEDTPRTKRQITPDEDSLLNDSSSFEVLVDDVTSIESTTDAPDSDEIHYGPTEDEQSENEETDNLKKTERPFSFVPQDESEFIFEQSRPKEEAPVTAKGYPNIGAVIDHKDPRNKPLPKIIPDEEDHVVSSRRTFLISKITENNHPLPQTPVEVPIELARVVTIRRATVAKPEPPAKLSIKPQSARVFSSPVLPVFSKTSSELEEASYEYSPRKVRDVTPSKGRLSSRLPIISSQRLSNVFQRFRSLSVREPKSKPRAASPLKPRHKKDRNATSPTRSPTKSPTKPPTRSPTRSPTRPIGSAGGTTVAESDNDEPLGFEVTLRSGELARQKVRGEILRVVNTLSETSKDREILLEALKVFTLIAIPFRLLIIEQLYEAVFNHYTDNVRAFEKARMANRQALKNWECSHTYLFKVHQMVLKKLGDIETMQMRKQERRNKRKRSPTKS
jgi:hypothetical protein